MTARTIRTLALAAALAAGGGAVATAQQDPEQEGTEAQKEAFFAELGEAGPFGALVEALRASDATWFLEEGEPYTLLAPTDEAFDALPEGVIEALIRDDNRPKLNAILERHLIPDDALAAGELSGREALDPASGEPLDVSASGERVTIDDATVTEADIRTENGVVHAIDAVLVPEIVVEAMKYIGDWPEAEEGEAAE